MNLEVQVQQVSHTPSRLVEGEGLVVSTKRGEAAVINGVGFQIWSWIEKKTSLQQVVDRLCQHYDVERQQAEVDTVEFINELKALELVEFC